MSRKTSFHLSANLGGIPPAWHSFLRGSRQLGFQFPFRPLARNLIPATSSIVRHVMPRPSSIEIGLYPIFFRRKIPFYLHIPKNLCTFAPSNFKTDEAMGYNRQYGNMYYGEQLVYTTDAQGLKYVCGKADDIYSGSTVTFKPNEIIAFVIGAEESHSKTLAIPSNITAKTQDGRSYREYNVIGIKDGSFMNDSTLESIKIPSSIKIIQMNAFDNCTALTSITIPDSVVEIGSEAFCECESLHSVSLSNNLKEIEYDTFARCRNLEYVSIGKFTEHISKDAFRRCTNLRRVYLPLGATCYSELAASLPDSSIISRTSGDNYNTSTSKSHNISSYQSVNKKTAVAPSTSSKPSKTNLVRKNSTSGCYVATAVYGSYDCPEVWTLRRYRDNVLDNTWYGKLFIRTYYAISPTLVKWFGTTNWFRELFLKPLNKWVAKLNKSGFDNTPYQDKY